MDELSDVRSSCLGNEPENSVNLSSYWNMRNGYTGRGGENSTWGEHSICKVGYT